MRKSIINNPYICIRQIFYMQQIDLLMTSEQKKAFLLLKAVIFQYHGLNEEEGRVLRETAESLGALGELDWVTEFISTDLYTAFERAKICLNEQTAEWDVDTKLSYLASVWESTNKKGHVTEMEATTMLKIAKEWKVQKELMMIIRKR